MSAGKNEEDREVVGLAHKKGQRFQKRKQALIPLRFQPRFWEDSDQRVSTIKTIRARVQLLKEHCGADSVQKNLLCERVAFISTVLETKEVHCVETGEMDLGSYIQATNSLVGLLRILGLNKAIKNITNLESYLEQKRK